MATSPQINLRDGSGTTQNLVFTTNETGVILTGTISVDTADVQVSVNGAAFVSDSSLVSLELQEFTIPNLSSYPTGLLLEVGVNTIAIRTIDIVGGVSAPALATVTRVSNIGGLAALIPTGIRVRRRRDAVDLLAAVPVVDNTNSAGGTNATFLGFNFYASETAAGATGYFRINEKPIQTLFPNTYEQNIFATFEDSTTWTDPKLQNIRIHVTEEDVFGNVLADRLDQVYDSKTFTGSPKFSSTLIDNTLTSFASFRHYRSGGPGIINSDQFVGVPDSDPLYYVITGLYYDTATTREIESPYSQEVLGLPLILDTAIRDLPGRNQFQVTLSYADLVQQVNRSITLNPGSTTRDVSIDPFASEAARLWFIVDFIHRCQSFLTLIQIDDAKGTGNPDSVADSVYKQTLGLALGLEGQPAAIQALFNSQFDKLAANNGKTRLPGRPAVGRAVVYTYVRPTQNISISAGSFVTTNADSSNNLPSVRFRIGGTYTMYAANAASYYNFDTKRYEITVDITCETIGTVGNRSAGTIVNITGVPGVQVTNTESTVFGTDQESNEDLAARAELAYASVDTGTEGGYQSTAASEIGITKAKIVKSGDPLMMRDYYQVLHKHIGGKVDIWVQGLRERQTSDRFAFTFEIARDIQCQIIDLANLKFRVMDSRVTPTTPVVEILNNISQGLGVRNVTIGQDYDLTGVQILDYQTFQLSTAITQPVTHIDDIILVDYRFRAANKFYFTLQPVRRVVSVIGEVSGALDPLLGYDLYKTDDPLLIGESTISTDYLSINQVAGVPSGNGIVQNDEAHVLIGFVQEPLASVGINIDTIRVFNEQRTIEFDGPTAAIPDFDIITGGPTTPAKIVRTASSAIQNGQQVSVDYVHDENFTATYVINDLLQQLQQMVNIQRHVTADVLVKQAIENFIDIENTIQLKRGATKEKVDPAVRSNVSLELDTKTIGQGIAQSDIIAVVDNTNGVDYSPVPYAKTAYADGSRKLREGVLSTNTLLSSLAIGNNRAFILTNPLTYPTTDNGGTATEHRGVFQDDESMALASALATVAQNALQAFIIGSEGAVIAGYSDNATLTAEGFVTQADRDAERLRRTANHIVVSLVGSALPPDEPTNHAYAVSYVIRGDDGAHDITTSAVEDIALGNFTITYRGA